MGEMNEPTWEEILQGEYYSIGVCGAQALVNMLADWHAGMLSVFCEEAGIGEAEFIAILNRFAVKLASQNLLHVVAGVRA